MNCSFKTIEDGVHQCIYCGRIVRLQIDPSQLMSPCTGGRAQPGILEKAGNFVQAVVDHAKDGFAEVSQEEQGRRMDICRKCPNFDGSTCKLCGCFCNLKARWRTSSCPDNPPRW